MRETATYLINKRRTKATARHKKQRKKKTYKRKHFISSTVQENV